MYSYVLFSIGNLSPLFKKAFPQCWDKHKICAKGWINAVDYLEIIGIIVGQALVGVIGDWYVFFFFFFFFFFFHLALLTTSRLGRRWGLIQDALIMVLGLVMLTAAWGVDQNGWVICYAWSLFIYGIGVGKCCIFLSLP